MTEPYRNTSFLKCKRILRIIYVFRLNISRLETLWDNKKTPRQSIEGAFLFFTKVEMFISALKS